MQSVTPAAYSASARIPDFLCLAAVVLVLLAGGCGTERTRGPNQPPTLTLTPEPVQGDELAYNARFTWSATDPDGAIARFEYAMDPPAAFTESEIADGGPGIVSEVLPGESGQDGVTRVSKMVNGKTVSFDWIHTRNFSRRFTFSATEADSIYTPDGMVPNGRFRGMHALYVRAVDDEGAVSAPGKAAFTATTVAPVSRLLRPEGLSQVGVGPEVTARWGGDDPDGDFARSGHFEYKLIDISNVDYADRDPDLLLARPEGWVSTGEASKNLSMACCGWLYMLGVRAVDAAGAQEPFLELGRNAVMFTVYRAGRRPLLTVQAQVYGATVLTTSSSTQYDPVTDVSVAPNAQMRFSWSASADAYYGRIWGYSWAFDLVDPAQEYGWSSWSDITTTRTVAFPETGLHTLYVRARDGGGGTTLGTVRIHVVDFQPEHEVLYVDDSYDNQFPTDTEHDAFWRARFQAYGADYGEFHAHGLNDREYLSPHVPTLDDLSRYRMVVWETFGSGYNGETALLHAATLMPTLRSYLLAGGQLWLGGRMSVPPCLDSPNGIRADLTYPIDEDRIVPGTFAYDFLKLRGAIRNPQGSTDPRNLMVGVAPYPGGPAPYDSMSVWQGKLRYPYQVAVPYVDVLFGPMDDEAEPGFRGDVDSLYAYRAYGNEVQGTNSDFQGRLVAIRWHDPDPLPLHGRIQWFGFPLYYMNDSEAQETFNRSLDWFREEDNTAP